MHSTPDRLLLRDLSLPTRLVIAFFLISVGLGYFGALVQLHFQHASAGQFLPQAEDAVHVYHGRSNLSQLERLLVADEGKPFNGSGSMRQTFTTRSAGWRRDISRRATSKKLSLLRAEEQLRSERDGERLAMLAWIRAGADQKPFEENNYVLPASLTQHPITSDFMETGADKTLRVKIAGIVEARCARCHSEGAGGSAGKFPLDTWAQLHAYCEVPTAGGGMSLTRLAQSTHVHLLGFALLYGATGVIVTLTSYPGWLRGLLACFPLAAQLVDIGCWWLARLDPAFAQAILFSGGAVAVSLFLQISLSLWNLFGRPGRLILLLFLLSACVGGYVLKELVIDPYLAREAVSATQVE
jgi:hypothetical protein